MQDRRDFLNIFRSLAPAPDSHWLHVNRPAMACRFEVTLPIWEQGGVLAARDALDEVDRLEQQLTVFRDSSEVSYINRNAAAESVTVEPSLFGLLLLCQELHRETEGAFDVTSGPLTRCWGFLKREGRVPGDNEIESARSLVGSDKLRLDHESRTIRFAQLGIGINLGSIGKGYALDRVVSLIGAGSPAGQRGCHARWGANNRVQTALLNAGASSIRAIGSGERGHGGWLVGLRHPRYKNKRMALLRIRDCAMSTSGSEEQFFEHNGKRYGHIIDPRSGWPAESVTSVTVVAQSTAISDALATAFYVGGRELAERYCAAQPDVLVIMLESSSECPVVIGSNSRCEIEWTV